MKIIFKDVGQGDSIILEWECESVRKIGIIDCNKKEKTNPVRDHIESLIISEIEFIILSHPHSDHFSGMLELLNYIEEKGIVVKKFAHSLFILGRDFYKYLRWMEVDSAALLDLQRLVEKVDKLRTAGVIQKMEFVNERWQDSLGPGKYLKCLAPAQEEAELYMKIVDGEPEKNKREASNGANYLSTVFCLVDGDQYHLLTSDGERSTFERLVHQKGHKELLEKRLHVGQLPHHGSSKNYYQPFWAHLTKCDERHAVASAGENMKYKHPHAEVLKAFYNDGYKVHCTSLFHGSQEFLDYIRSSAATSGRLDTISILINSYTAGDKVF